MSSPAASAAPPNRPNRHPCDTMPYVSTSAATPARDHAADLLASSEPPATNAKLQNRSSRKPSFATQQFLRDDKALRLAQHVLTKSITPLIDTVIYGPPSPLPIPSLYHGASILTLTPTSIGAINVGLDDRDAAGKKLRKPVSFNRLPDEGRARFGADYLIGLGSPAWVTIDIADTILELGEDKDLLPWLLARVKPVLKHVLGRNVSAIYALEDMSEKKVNGVIVGYERRPHIHALMHLHRHEFRRVEEALKQDNCIGCWDRDAEDYQILITESYSHDCRPIDFGVAGYMTKDAYKHRIRGFVDRFNFPANSDYRLSFAGPVFSMTEDVRKGAEALYKRAVDDVRAARCGELEIELRPAPPPATPAAVAAEELDPEWAEFMRDLEAIQEMSARSHEKWLADRRAREELERQEAERDRQDKRNWPIEHDLLDIEAMLGDLAVIDAPETPIIEDLAPATPAEAEEASQPRWLLPPGRPTLDES